MRAAVPTVSTPGVFSPGEDDVTPLDAIQFELENDPEVDEAIRHFALSLYNGVPLARASASLNERLHFLYLRAERSAETRLQDEHEEGFL